MIEIARAIFQPEVLIFLIPISAIVGAYYYKIQKLKLESGGMNPQNALTNDELRRIRETLDQNKQLQERVQNLETIITSLDREIPISKIDDASRVKDMINKLEK